MSDGGSNSPTTHDECVFRIRRRRLIDRINKAILDRIGAANKSQSRQASL